MVLSAFAIAAIALSAGAYYIYSTFYKQYQNNRKAQKAALDYKKSREDIASLLSATENIKAATNEVARITEDTATILNSATVEDLTVILETIDNLKKTSTQLSNEFNKAIANTKLPEVLGQKANNNNNNNKGNAGGNGNGNANNNQQQQQQQQQQKGN